MDDVKNFEPTPARAPEEKKILRVYGAFAAALVMMFVPHAAACVLALLLFSGTMTAAYIVRRKSEADSLTAGHMTHIIRTMWIGSAMAFLTTIVATLFMLPQINYDPVNACTEPYQAAMAAGDSAAAIDSLRQCLDEFMATNMPVLMMATVMAAALPLVYFLLCLARGLSRALKGHRIGRPQKPAK